MSKRGRFITVEGQDGSGKSTNLEAIRSTLHEAGIDVIETREPGGTAFGETLRSILLKEKQLEICDKAELLLIFAARAQHIEHVIQPALRSGRWVLCDRFTDATYAYQGGGRGIKGDLIVQLEQWVQQGLQPDLTILFDVPVEVGADRSSQRSEPDRFESELRDFKQKVRATYLELAARHPQRIVTVNADRELELVRAEVVAIVSEFISREQV